jgi:hypothetical protein
MIKLLTGTGFVLLSLMSLVQSHSAPSDETKPGDQPSVTATFQVEGMVIRNGIL